MLFAPACRPGKKARIERHAFHKTDMKATWADISKAKTLLMCWR
jgi:hypothetical protein